VCGTSKIAHTIDFFLFRGFVDDLSPKVACGIQDDVVREIVDSFLQKGPNGSVEDVNCLGGNMTTTNGTEGIVMLSTVYFHL
jgi:hypothetical protein